VQVQARHFQLFSCEKSKEEGKESKKKRKRNGKAIMSQGVDQKRGERRHKTVPHQSLPLHLQASTHLRFVGVSCEVLVALLPACACQVDSRKKERRKRKQKVGNQERRKKKKEEEEEEEKERTLFSLISSAEKEKPRERGSHRQ
jgi:hypothetical protein